MDIKTLEDYKLSDAIKFNDTLNPRLWDKSEHLKPKVRKHLLKIADDFRDFLGVPDINVEDITVSGSNAAFTYTPHSDIDLHLVVNYPTDNPVYAELFDAKKNQYNNEHDISIGGFPVELYVQQSDQKHVSNGVYSLKNNKWIEVPTRRKATVDDTATKNKYDDFKNRIDNAIASKNLKRMTKVSKELKRLRQNGLDEHGEFGPENLAFKILRTQGDIGRLKDARTKLRDEELSLAERNKQKVPFKYGYKTLEDVTSTPDGVSATTDMFADDIEQKPSKKEIIKDFVEFCIKNLGLDNPPKIQFRRDPQWSIRNHSFGRYDTENNHLDISLVDRHVLDILRTVAHELTHQHQDETSDMPPNAGEDGSPQENEANATAGVLMRKYGKLHPELFAADTVAEATGYIPTAAEANDPRFLMALTQDVRPGEVGRCANAFLLNTDSQGHPQVANPSGKVERQLAESWKRFKLNESTDTEIDEVNMSPGHLQKWASGPGTEGMMMGVEFELYVPGIAEGGDEELDYDADESVHDIDDIANFFSDTEGYNSVHRRLAEEYQDWRDEASSRFIEENYDEDEIRSIIAFDHPVKDFYDEAEESLSDISDEEDNPTNDHHIWDRARELQQEFIDHAIEEQTRVYDDAREQYEERLLEDADIGESDWLRDIGVRYASDAESGWGLAWPHFTSEGGDADTESVARSLYNALDIRVVAGSDYHSISRSPGKWIVEPDSSLDSPNSSLDAGAEIVSPPMPVPEMIEYIRDVQQWAKNNDCYTNKTTGLHMNVSVPNFSIETLDYIKLALFLGDEHILQQFGRTANGYCRAATKKIQDNLDSATTQKVLERMRTQLDGFCSKLIHSGRTDKYTSINTHSGYVEFRGPGGDWLSKSPEQLTSTALRTARALSIACDPEAEKQEYAKKFYKLIAPMDSNNDTVSLFAKYTSGELTKGDLKASVRQIQADRQIKPGLYTVTLKSEPHLPITVFSDSPNQAIEKARYMGTNYDILLSSQWAKGPVDVIAGEPPKGVDRRYTYTLRKSTGEIRYFLAPDFKRAKSLANAYYDKESYPWTITNPDGNSITIGGAGQSAHYNSNSSTIGDVGQTSQSPVSTTQTPPTSQRWRITNTNPGGGSTVRWGRSGEQGRSEQEDWASRVIPNGNYTVEPVLSDEITESLSLDDLTAVEKFADKLWQKYGVDVNFTHHFIDRVNDSRGNKPISAAELVRLFKKEYQKWGKDISGLDDNEQGVMKDRQTDVNVPFAIKDHGKHHSLIAKTIMRKNNFTTTSPEYVVEQPTDKITETLNQPYDWYETESDDTGVYYEFKVPGQVKPYAVAFLAKGQGRYAITFMSFDEDDRPQYDVTGSGDAFRIFATVTEILQQFVHEYNPSMITFSAKKPSRIKLYDRLAKVLLPKLGFEQQQTIGGRGTYAFVSIEPRSGTKSELDEGGYASTLTQNTKITPAVVDVAVKHIQKFIKDFNKYLASKDLPPVKGGEPVGSTFYYKKDQIENPEKEYGDIDVRFFIPQLPNMSDAAITALYAKEVKEFAEIEPNLSTSTGKNVIFKIGPNDYIQVDLVMSYYDNKEWMGALVPERNIKGVIGSSVYSSLAELLNLSIGDYGVRAKMRDGQPVSFRQSKNTDLVTISKNPKEWALDILRFYANLAGVEDPVITKDLSQHRGSNPDNIRIADTVDAIKGLGHSLEANDLFGRGSLSHIPNYHKYINDIENIYANKINSVINSSKFDKAVEPQAAAKAQSDKQKLQTGLEMVQGLFK
jgi:Putative amidoligase enzyme